MSVTIAKIHAILLFCSLTEAVLYSPRFTGDEQSSLEYIMSFTVPTGRLFLSTRTTLAHFPATIKVWPPSLKKESNCTNLVTS